MIKISDFKVGQTVYIESISSNYRGLRSNNKIREDVVTEVGRKYITVGYDKFQASNLDFYEGCFVQKTNYSPDFILYPSKQYMENVLYKRKLVSKTESLLSKNRLKKLSVEQLEEILKIISVEEGVTDGR